MVGQSGPLWIESDAAASNPKQKFYGSIKLVCFVQITDERVKSGEALIMMTFQGRIPRKKAPIAVAARNIARRMRSAQDNRRASSVAWREIWPLITKRAAALVKAGNHSTSPAVM